jgi:hypothetical protein
MEPTLIGYFPKKTMRRPDWLEADHVEEVCSASECVSEGPKEWVKAWKHNDNWLFDSPEIAEKLVPKARDAFDMYAFSQYPIRVDNGEVVPEAIRATSVMSLPEDFELLGYDAVARSCGASFECSPLSCNYGAKDFPCNSHCLFDTLEQAVEAAKEFSHGPWEPGPYYVVAVYRKKKGEPAVRL